MGIAKVNRSLLSRVGLIFFSIHIFESILIKLHLYNAWWRLERFWWSKFIKKDARLIPHGPYCYEWIIDPIPLKNHNVLLWRVCPYARNKLTAEEQNFGYCIYLDKGDFDEDGTSLLWDQCKECGINDDEEEG
jgi:hypothetical protein